MKKLITQIKKLRQEEIRNVIDFRMKEFESLGKRQSPEIFKELCFCLMTANFNAAKSIKIQNELGDNFGKLSLEELAVKLKELGHRFPNTRAGFIFEAREHKNNIKKILTSFDSETEARMWLVKNIKGLGLKESSHFLRNIGYKNVAIIDFHIIDLLVKHELVERPKTITPKIYLEIEDILKELSKKVGINLGELDLYLWYEETGKVLK